MNNNKKDIKPQSVMARVKSDEFKDFLLDYALYIILGTSFCIFLLIFKPAYTMWGLGIVLAGIPVYYITIAGNKRNATNIKS